MKVQVIGAGFSGLSVAYFLSKAGHEVRLVETSPRFGGLLHTEVMPEGIVETAANALLSNALVEKTAEELGIELVAALPTAKNRFILRDGRMRKWPLNFGGNLRFALRTVPKYFLAKFLMAPKPRETIAGWGRRNLGRQGLDQLLAPGLSGVYAGDVERLSATLILGRFFGKGTRVPPGKRKGSVAPRAGMGEWAKAFRKALEAKHVKFAFEAADGLPTIVALPPNKAAQFFASRAPALSAELQKIEMLSLLTVTIFLPDTDPGIEGFGCVFPRSEGFRVLGVLSNDRIFPDRTAPGFRSETWIFGGATDPQAVSLTNIEKLITDERAKLFPGSEPPLKYSVHRWPDAIPHYSLELEAALPRLTALAAETKTYSLFGTYLGDLGLARVLARAEALSRSFS
jgi:oxygen-dependent protoporphyrinogen oxidase